MAAFSGFFELFVPGTPLVGSYAHSDAAGDKLFVNYAGDGDPVVVDRLTGKRRTAQISGAVLGGAIRQRKLSQQKLSSFPDSNHRVIDSLSILAGDCGAQVS